MASRTRNCAPKVHLYFTDIHRWHVFMGFIQSKVCGGFRYPFTPSKLKPSKNGWNILANDSSSQAYRSWCYLWQGKTCRRASQPIWMVSVGLHSAQPSEDNNFPRHLGQEVYAMSIAVVMGGGCSTSWEWGVTVLSVGTEACILWVVCF